VVAFVRPGEDGEPAADEKIIKGVCLDAASWVVGSCLDFFTQYIAVAPAAIEFFDAEQLPALRERLDRWRLAVPDLQECLVALDLALCA
jgi:hypothetical protein